MGENGWLTRLKRFFRKEDSARAHVLPEHPFRTAPVTIEENAEENGASTDLAERDLPPSLRSLLEKKRGSSV